ncbi:MAG TPA: metallophosphoesterase [Phycisphaerales bacterium]|nr:metallophosphoesterase [Phycisphaerales bacterium]
MRRVAHIADVHFGAATAEAVQALEAALDVIAPDIVVVSGDLTQHGRRSEFRDAAAFVERLPGIVVAVPGNHDVPREIAPRFVSPLGRYDRSIGPVATDRFADNEVAIIGINSARAWGLHWNWAHGRVGHADIAEARVWLAARPSGVFGGLVVHHPPVLFEPRRGFHELGRGRHLLRMLGAVGAEAVMSGHLHATGWRMIDGVLHMQAGTSASHRVRGEANAFLILEVHEDRLELESWLVGEEGEFARGRQERIVRPGIHSPDARSVVEADVGRFPRQGDGR